MFLDRLLLFFPIRVVFPVFIIVIFLVLGLYFGWVEIENSKKQLRKDKKEHICKIAAGLQEMAEFSAWRKNVELIERRLINESADPYIDIIFLSDPSGKVIMSSKRKFIGKDFHQVLQSYLPYSYDKVLNFIKVFEKKAELVCEALNKEEVIVAVSPVMFYKDKIRTTSTGLLYIQYNIGKVEEIYRRQIIAKLINQYAVFLVMFALLYIGFNKMIGERIEVIVSATKRIAKGDIDVRINLKGKDEFALIASIINNLVERLNKYISYDYLTGILNRFGLEKQIKKLLDKNPDLWDVLILIDLDNFKEVNDTFGHDVGDQLLKSFAKRVKRLFSDKVVGRLGGDEFIVFFQSKEKPDIEEEMRKIQSFLSEDIYIEDIQFDISFTAGISIKKSCSSFFQLLKESDIALYYGKKKGKRLFVVFNEDIKLEEERKVKLNEILKKSKERESFYLLYQPIIELKTKKTYAVEALLRMKDHDELGKITPDEFIPILEETGLIKQVGYWIIDEVCRQMKEWNRNLSNWIPVSINIDIQQLLDEDFVENVKEILLRYDINPRYIKFEITESEAMKFPEVTVDVLKRLRDIGIHIAIDDFGTGYSSLSYLKMMPVSYIKIDRSFVKNIPDSREDNILVMTIVNLAKSFGFKTIAEGVENKVQLLFLEEIGCDYVQGYYFSRPVPPTEIEKMFKNQA